MINYVVYPVVIKLFQNKRKSGCDSDCHLTLDSQFYRETGIQFLNGGSDQHTQNPLCCVFDPRKEKEEYLLLPLEGNNSCADIPAGELEESGIRRIKIELSERGRNILWYYVLFLLLLNIFYSYHYGKI
eukprot:snap_masked-scaffold_45-processed-gene-1.85-mRNA-1 protein AED:1.00 eAED:1.00 QI:0/0/0/0/1/1/2/0/128